MPRGSACDDRPDYGDKVAHLHANETKMKNPLRVTAMAVSFPPFADTSPKLRRLKSAQQRLGGNDTRSSVVWFEKRWEQKARLPPVVGNAREFLSHCGKWICERAASWSSAEWRHSGVHNFFALELWRSVRLSQLLWFRESCFDVMLIHQYPAQYPAHNITPRIFPTWEVLGESLESKDPSSLLMLGLIVGAGKVVELGAGRPLTPPGASPMRGTGRRAGGVPKGDEGKAKAGRRRKRCVGCSRMRVLRKERTAVAAQSRGGVGRPAQEEGQGKCQSHAGGDGGDHH